MNEDVFNMEVRKFLKKVGVTSQREIETAVPNSVPATWASGPGSSAWPRASSAGSRPTRTA